MSTITTRTKYATRLCGTDEDPKIELLAVQRHTVVSPSGRRMRTKEHTLNAASPDVILGELTMRQAGDLLCALASDVSFMAIPSNLDRS